MSKHDIAALQQIAREFTAGFNSGDVDRIMRYYGDRYVDVNLRSPVQNFAERRQYYLDVITQRKIKVDVQPDEILVEGNIALIRGTINITSPDGTRGELRYLEVAHKDEDGSWRMLWGMDGPVQEYPPKETR